MKAALEQRQFLLLFIGQAISYIGDQFHLIALPWLVLTITHDPLQLGGVLAAAGIPRALVMLFGGVTADRHSPRTIMLVSDALRFVITGALAVAIFTGAVQLWMVYVLAIVFGIVSGFFMPASHATVPRVLPAENLESGNALMMGAGQLAGFLGPVAAGVLIAWFGGGFESGGEQTASLAGIGVAFSIDALSFLASAVALAAMRPVPPANSGSDAHPLEDVAAGLRYTLGSVHLRSMLIVIAWANFLIAGPMFVGMPVVAQERLGGAAAFGVVMSAYAVGSLLGMIAAATLPRPADKTFGWLVAGLLAAFGVVMASLGSISSMWVVTALMVMTGVGNGFIGIHAMTALQRMTTEKYLGRVMSMVTLAMVGLMPVSEALSGAILRVSAELLFALAGIGFVLVGAWSVTRRDVWELTAEKPEAEPATT